MCQDCGCSVVGGIGLQVYLPEEHQHPENPTHGLNDSHPQGPDTSERPVHNSTIHAPVNHNHDHDHDHPHDHHHPSQDRHQRTVTIAQSVLSKNDRLAERNRGYFLAKNVWVLNLLSSPGSGKTALLERTLGDRSGNLSLGVIVGDLETDNDAQRLRNGNTPVAQITTGTVCHLEADMVMKAAQQLDLEALDVLVIENVGNLVCPAAYDLGEDCRVVLLSVTEGEDKPLKYPTMFKSADVVLVTKMDIAAAVGFDRDRAIAHIQRVAPQATILQVSARTGEGMDQWYAYLNSAIQEHQHPHSHPAHTH